MATKTKPKPKAKVAAKKAEKASEAKTGTPAKPIKLQEVGDFVKFTGYSTETGEDAVFKTDDTLYIAEIDTSDEATGTMYGCIKAEDVTAYMNDPESVTGGQVGPGEVTPIKGGALETLKEKFLPIKLVGRMGKLLEGREDDLINVAIELNEQAQESYFYLGGALAKILQEGSYLKENGGTYEGDNAFEDFCEETFGFRQAKGRDLARIYTTFAAMSNFKPEMLKKIGWSNARAVQRYATEENLTEVLALAENHTQRDLPVILREQFVQEGNTTPSGAAATRGGNIKKVTITFKLLDDAAQGVKMALTEVMKEKAYKDESEALEFIVMTYAQEHLGGSETKQSRIVKKLEKSASARIAKPAAAAKPVVKAKPKPAAAAAA